MSAQSLLTQKGSTVHTISQEATLKECIDLLTERQIGALIVTDKKGGIQGLISERDVLRALAASPKTGKKGCDACGTLVKKVMTPRKQLTTAAPDADITKLMETMTEKKIRHIPVVQDGRLVGIVSIGDVVKKMLEATETENKQMKDYIYGPQT